MPNPNYRKIFEFRDKYETELPALEKLAAIMSGKLRLPAEDMMFELTEEIIPAKPPQIPSGYTYLAQFIAHDISFDEASDRHQRADFPGKIIDHEALKNLRNLRKPAFDLEHLYGHSIPANKGEIKRGDLLLRYAPPLSNKPPLPLLKLGNTKGAALEPPLGIAGKSYPNDLPRKNACVEAKIVDPRNDENLLLAQTQVVFTKFHNALVVKLSQEGDYTYEGLFEKARKLTIRYYQTIILTDFLPRVVQKSVLEAVIAKLSKKEWFYLPEPDDMYIPLEFSVAAFRFAHSMIRNDYNLNPNHLKIGLSELMTLTGKGEMGTVPMRAVRLNLPSTWIIDWNLFYETGTPSPNFNFAEPINTELPLALLSLFPKAPFRSSGRANALAILDLYRGRRFELPAGQDVAEKIRPGSSLKPEQIKDLILSKQVDGGSPAEVEAALIQLSEAFAEKTPLWFYILAEAEIQTNDEIKAGNGFENAGKLGEVGSRIVAETVIQILYNSEYSILRHEWEDNDGFLLKTDQTFDMPAMLKFIQEMGEKHYKELYPRKFYPDTRNKFDELNPLEKGYQAPD